MDVSRPPTRRVSRSSLLILSLIVLFGLLGRQFDRCLPRHLWTVSLRSQKAFLRQHLTPRRPEPHTVEAHTLATPTDGSRQIDVYACKPAWPETGPEQLYRLHTSASQPITLTLSYPATPGLDLDVFLLAHSDPEQCYGADASLSVSDLPPGDHLIVIDGYNGSAGDYALSVDCDEPPFATATPTYTPVPTATPTPTVSPTPTPTPGPTPTRPHLTYYAYLPTQGRTFPPPTPEPTTIVFQPGADGYEGVADSYLDAWANTANYANVDRMFLRQPDIMAPIIRFALTSLPSNAVVVEAKLSLWAISQSNDNPATVGLYQLNRSWNANEVTWQQATTEQTWNQPGANGVPSDRSDHPYDVQEVSQTAQWYEWDLTALVSSWLFDPASNDGLVLKAFAEPRVLYAFASADYNNPEARPKLTIRYWTRP